MLSFFAPQQKAVVVKAFMFISHFSKLTMLMFSFSFHVNLKDRRILFNLDHDLSFCLWSFNQETIVEG